MVAMCRRSRWCTERLFQEPLAESGHAPHLLQCRPAPWFPFQHISKQGQTHTDDLAVQRQAVQRPIEKRVLIGRKSCRIIVSNNVFASRPKQVDLRGNQLAQQRRAQRHLYAIKAVLNSQTRLHAPTGPKSTTDTVDLFLLKDWNTQLSAWLGPPIRIIHVSSSSCPCSRVERSS